MFYFTPLPGVFSPFPRGTCSLSVASQYLALPDGPGGFVQGFTCPVLLGILLGFRAFRLPDCHRLWWAIHQTSSTTLIPSRDGVPQPHYDLRHNGLGSSAFTRRY